MAGWCQQLNVHPLAAQCFQVDAWVRHLSITAQPRLATIAPRLSALSGFYDYGIREVCVLTDSPVAPVRRPASATRAKPSV